ncbi:MAG: CBS domain-containing protein [Candidatus Altiarchaeales archaeon]|nr:CBS domain-containing protein [Candidatus Altiarchaeales archaeon]MBD3415835.1 CBS domain-containing protein [Candidatus Altiarchaeales archaeon]
MMTWKPIHYAKKRVKTCTADCMVRDAAKMFKDENMGSLIVTDEEGNHMGLFTDAVLFKAISNGLDLRAMKLGDLDLEPIVRADKNADFGDVQGMFKESPSGRLVLYGKEGEIAGVLKRKNVERFGFYKAASRMLRRR